MGGLDLSKSGISAVKENLSKLREYFFNAEDPQARQHLRILIISGSILLLFLITTSGLFYLSSRPSFCEICHEMGPDVRAWQKSMHAEVDCTYCHLRPGALPYLAQEAGHLREVYLHVTNDYRKPINGDGHVGKEIKDERCEQCHTVKRKITPTKGIIINHIIHKKKGILCTTCHNRTGHPKIEEYATAAYPVGVKNVAGVYRNGMKMDSCLICHNGVKAPKKCETCHPPDYAFAPVKGPNAHDAAWQKNHGKQARTNAESCYNCHERESCADCHGTPLPHSSQFTMTATHGQTARQNLANCLRCHPDQGWCMSCHHKGYRPEMGPWIRVHPSVAEVQGVADCFNCHNPVYCARCHIRAGEVLSGRK